MWNTERVRSLSHNKPYVAVSLAAHFCSIQSACFEGSAPCVSLLILSMSCDVSERREAKHCQRGPTMVANDSMKSWSGLTRELLGSSIFSCRGTPVQILLCGSYKPHDRYTNFTNSILISSTRTRLYGMKTYCKLHIAIGIYTYFMNSITVRPP